MKVARTVWCGNQGRATVLRYPTRGKPSRPALLFSNKKGAVSKPRLFHVCPLWDCRVAAAPKSVRTLCGHHALSGGYASKSSWKSRKLGTIDALRVTCFSRLRSSIASRRDFTAVTSLPGKRPVRIVNVLSILI